MQQPPRRGFIQEGKPNQEKEITEDIVQESFSESEEELTDDRSSLNLKR